MKRRKNPARGIRRNAILRLLPSTASRQALSYTFDALRFEDEKGVRQSGGSKNTEAWLPEFDAPGARSARPCVMLPVIRWIEVSFPLKNSGGTRRSAGEAWSIGRILRRDSRFRLEMLNSPAGVTTMSRSHASGGSICGISCAAFSRFGGGAVSAHRPSRGLCVTARAWRAICTDEKKVQPCPGACGALLHHEARMATSPLDGQQARA